ncbi:hypothetical protein [Arthrobacter sp. 24S4-2]|uniref:sunset domain-containing protein n=1 Tax=Arthrobacter sp. 24S4-2 TaxID=2575374 RepID=UPI0020C75766|nr:hypothetical protein [Arthrobacter sp. 24S4-2]
MSSDSGVSAPRTEQTGAGRPAGTLAGGSAAASAEAAATTGMAGASGFASPSGPTLPTTRDDATAVAREAPAASAAATSTPAPAAAAAPAPAGSAPAAASGGDVDDWDEDTTAATGTPAANTGTPAAEPGQAGTDSSGSTERGGAAAGGKAEWEAQWSEAASTPHAAGAPAGESPATATQAPAAATPPTPIPVSAGTQMSGAQAPIHHPEYTEPHAPTLPGAESAAAEDVPVTGTRAEAEAPSATGEGTAPGVHPAPPSAGDAETMQAAASSAATEAAASHMAEPAGHLAADKPYGEGSAAPGPDGSGPEGYTVKGNAQSMIYHDDTSPDYGETVAEVWFESAAHAEAAGFRAPRRSRH